MSVAKRVSEAIDKMEASDPEGALFAICAALGATADKEFSQTGGENYRRFIHENLGLITDIAFGGLRILNIRLEFDHPKLTKNPDGTYQIQEILYNAVRCGLYHEAGLPTNLQFTHESRFACNDGAIVLPASLVYGLIVAVVVAPVNANESTVKPSALNMRQLQIPIDKLWGRRAELLWLLNI